MAQTGGLMVPPALAKLPSEQARERLEMDQQSAMSAQQQLGWVPKLYYWIKQKYGDIGGSDLSEDPIWLMGVCHHVRLDPNAKQQPPLAQPPALGALARLNLRWCDPQPAAAAPDGLEDAPLIRRPLVAPDPAAVWQWFRSESADDDEEEGADDFAPYAEEEAVVEGCWVSYTQEETARLEAAYAAGQKTADIQSKWYVFLEEPMQQQAIGSGAGAAGSPAPRAVRRKASAPIEISAAAAADALTVPGVPERLLPGWGNFLEHVVSRVWCTYREGFSPVGPPIYTTDAGWGCMLRTAQMMLAQTLMRLQLGDNWLLPSSPALIHQPGAEGSPGGVLIDRDGSSAELTASSSVEAQAMLSPYRKLLRMFGDERDPECPYSLHYMVQVGGEFDMSTGQWYGPSLAARVIEQLVNSHPVNRNGKAKAMMPTGASGGATAAEECEGGDMTDLRVWVAPDSMGTMYRDAIQACAAGRPQPLHTATPEPEPEPEPEPAAGADGSKWRHPVLLLLPLMLGLGRNINPLYAAAVAAVFRLPQSVGFIGGSPSASYYFVAGQSATAAAGPDGTAAAAEDGGAGAGDTGAKTTLVYLDPHSVQPMVNVSDGSASTESYHCRSLRTMRLGAIDPSLTIGFLVKDQQDFDDLCAALPLTVGLEICAVFDTESSAAKDGGYDGEDSDDEEWS